MYQALLFLHSITRWLVLLSLVYAIYKAAKGLIQQTAFTKSDNATRHITATIAHVQLVIGITLYFKSPLIQYFWRHTRMAAREMDLLFFSLIHMLMMITAITVITIGSALAKRKPTDRAKYQTMLVWFGIAMLIIFLAIPWPFSPLAHRPYLR